MTAAVAYAGQPGAFAEDACRAFLPNYDAVPLEGFAEVAAAVLDGWVNSGMLPLANSVAGPVPGVAALIAQPGLSIVGTHQLPIRLHLLGLPNASLEALKTVTSHPMALAQCGAALDALDLQQMPADNTATAACYLADSGDRTRAVLASERAAALYGLRVLQRDLQDRADNATLFGVIRRER